MIQPLKLQATERVTGDFFTNRTWHLLIIDPSRPKTVADWLLRAKLWVYWPNYVVHVAGRCKTRRSKQVSVLHGYLPLAVSPMRQNTWDLVHRTPGIRGFLRDSIGNPAVIKETIIESIREIEGRLNLAPQQAAFHAYKPGTPVRFVGDKAQVWDNAKVISVADDGRISVCVTLFNRTVPMIVDAVEIEAI